MVPLFVGWRPAALLLARYTAARFGPDAALYPGPASGDLYREAALCFPLVGAPFPAIRFAAMWVDSADEAPLRLGDAYGFPKRPAAVAWRRREDTLWVGVARHGEEELELDAEIGPRLSSGWLPWVAGVWAVFPAAGLRAPMRLEGVREAALLRVQSLRLTSDAAAAAVRPLPGLWLPGVTVALGAPRPR
ncbi:MAG: acetoacetate decarboxylase family protein [Chloroflexi bacterium]|nr:acetoacetate decarboxylase family protein [Chloroflexota bacterium]